MSDDARERPDLRWNPGARYRPSALAGLPGLPGLHGVADPGRADVATAARLSPRLTGRLRRGPARRIAVFERDLWRPAQHVTTGLVRAVGRALGR